MKNNRLITHRSLRNVVGNQAIFVNFLAGNLKRLWRDFATRTGANALTLSGLEIEVNVRLTRNKLQTRVIKIHFGLAPIWVDRL